MTIPELAKYFEVSEGEIRDLLKSENAIGFPAFRVGRGWRVNLEELREWMCRQWEKKEGRTAGWKRSKAEVPPFRMKRK